MKAKFVMRSRMHLTLIAYSLAPVKVQYQQLEPKIKQQQDHTAWASKLKCTDQVLITVYCEAYCSIVMSLVCRPFSIRERAWSL